MLADGRVVLGWVDRFCDTPCIRVAVAPNIDGNFGPSLTLYDHTAHAAKALARRARTGQKEQAGATGGSTLEDSEQLSVWTHYLLALRVHHLVWSKQRPKRGGLLRTPFAVPNGNLF